VEWRERYRAPPFRRNANASAIELIAPAGNTGLAHPRQPPRRVGRGEQDILHDGHQRVTVPARRSGRSARNRECPARSGRSRTIVASRCHVRVIGAIDEKSARSAGIQRVCRATCRRLVIAKKRVGSTPAETDISWRGKPSIETAVSNNADSTNWAASPNVSAGEQSREGWRWSLPSRCSCPSRMGRRARRPRVGIARHRHENPIRPA